MFTQIARSAGRAMIGRAALPLIATTLAFAAFAQPATDGQAYPVPMHGIWVPETPEAHQECAQLRKQWNAVPTTNALRIDPSRLDEISEGEQSHATPLRTQRVAPRTWRITQEFHLYGDEAPQTLVSTYKLSASGRRMTHRFPYTLNNEPKEGSHAYFKCF